ncbi:hypothetical protein M413DRAFT_446170 [Hebeloma cylindrosporum]|uniref:Uncharacterized protein n=1 Tax=Hebeloma cylindrosporum TaxID=76867 RepID=A0A0C2YIA7_HEBCY|nr:hypothetical protein M413DRAFT_446170 [Hebeloma cylindrosporum h7]
MRLFDQWKWFKKASGMESNSKDMRIERSRERVAALEIPESVRKALVKSQEPVAREIKFTPNFVGLAGSDSFHFFIFMHVKSRYSFPATMLPGTLDGKYEPNPDVY